MIAQIKIDSRIILFSLVILAFISIIFIGDHLNHKFNMNDFKVMFMAAEAYLNRESVYGVPFGLNTGFYKYSPLTMLLFVPYTMVSFYTASVIHFILIGISAFLSILTIESIIREYLFPDLKKKFLTLFFIFLVILFHFHRDLHLGNVNLIIVLVLSQSLRLILKEKVILGGVFLALVIFAKPYFIICVIPLFFSKQFKAVLAVIISGVALLAFSFLIFGISSGMSLYSQWFEAMLAHSDYLKSAQTLFSIVNYYTGVSIDNKFALPLLGILAIGSSLIIWHNKWFKKDVIVGTDKKKLIIHFFFLLAIIPSILITDTEHFLFSLPFIVLLLSFYTQKGFLLEKICLALTFVLYGGNSSDILGSKLSLIVSDAGLLGIGNLIIIVWVVYLGLQLIKPKEVLS